MPNIRNTIWWGPPKKFSTQLAERKISWLELFYDLVYVIVISRVTHYLAAHPSASGLLDYAYLFAMTFWGWFNGSQYHDLHGSPGIRTRFMTLWQMMAAGALAVTLDSPPESLIYRSTIALLFLQLFITYLWWSVGIYDRRHRAMNRPYTLCFLLAFALLVLTFFIPLPWRRIVFWVALIINYMPFTLTALRLRNSDRDFSLSPSMTERLGLLATIVFGEAILGVINSVCHFGQLSFTIWLCFGLGILIVFALWWIFFSIVADRECKKGMWVGNLMSLTYVPTLASLGMIGATFPELMKNLAGTPPAPSTPLQLLYGTSIALFLCCITAISRFLVYPEAYEQQKKRFQVFFILTGIANLLLLFVLPLLPLAWYLLYVLVTLMIVVVGITRSWFRVEMGLHRE